MALLTEARHLLTHPHYTKYTAPLQLLADAALTVLIILKVPCPQPLLPSTRRLS